MGAENRGPELAAVVILLLVLSIVTVGLRCFARKVLLNVFFAEDWLAVGTLILYIAYSASALVSIGFGLGQHVDNVPAVERPHALLWKWLGQVLYVVISALVKFLVGLFLLRICSQQKWQRITIWTLLGLVGVFNAFYLFIVIFQCLPVEYYWFRYTDPQVIDGSCNKTALATIPTYISLFLNVIVDWALALLPVSFIYKSKMPMKTKISVVAVLGLGIVASFATIARIPYARQTLHSVDYLYNFTDLAIWSTVEIGLALIASSLATLKPLFRKFNLLEGTHGNTSGTAGLKDTTRGSTLHSRKRSIMSLGRGNSKNFDQIVDNETEMAVLEKGPRVHLKSVVEEDAPMGGRGDMRWDEESQQLSGNAKVTPSKMYGNW